MVYPLHSCLSFNHIFYFTVDSKNSEKSLIEDNPTQTGLFDSFNSAIQYGIMKAIESIVNTKEGFRTVFKKREGFDRFCLILLITAFILEMFTNYAWGNLFLYYRLKLNFGMSDFSTLMSIAGVCGLLGQFVLVPLFTAALKFHASTISLLGKNM